MSIRPAAAVVLAAGEGTRMRSATPKVLHEIGGRSLLGHAVAAVQGLDPHHLVVVVGHGRDQVREHLTAHAPDASVAVQEHQRGTGDAVRCALDALPSLAGTVVVTYGDVPLLTTATLQQLVRVHADEGNAATVVTAEVADPTGYGRIVRAADGGVEAIVEERDASAQQRELREINSGVYAFDVAVFRDALSRLTTHNAQGQLYLTDVLAIVRAGGRRSGALRTPDAVETEGVNDRVQLARLGAELNRRVLEGWMRAGVTVVDPATTWVDVGVLLEPDTTLLPGTQLHGTTSLATGAQVGPDSTLVDCRVGERARVVRTSATDADIGPESSVGPYTLLRPGTVLGPRVRAGAYVEIKGARIGADSKVPHLSYVGDADIGEGSNVGAATIFVNYDGVAKHHTVVGNEVRIGADTMLVAPVRLGDGSYTAAGSVIDQDVPPGAMAVARARQRNVEGWVERRRAGTPAARAAQAARENRAASENTAARGQEAAQVGEGDHPVRENAQGPSEGSGQ